MVRATMQRSLVLSVLLILLGARALGGHERVVPGATPSLRPPPDVVLTFFGGWGSSGQLRVWVDPAGLPVAALDLERRGAAGDVAARNAGSLTARGVRRVAALIDGLPSRRLLAVYPGCGAACDDITAVPAPGPRDRPVP